MMLENDRPSDESAAVIYTLRRCLAALPPEFREVLVMREWGDMSCREIAEAAGVPVGTVMSRLFRAHEQLRHHVLWSCK